MSRPARSVRRPTRGVPPQRPLGEATDAEGLTDAERRVLDAVRDLARDGALARDLEALLRIPSVTGSAAEADAQAWLARRPGAPRPRRGPLADGSGGPVRPRRTSRDGGAPRGGVGAGRHVARGDADGAGPTLVLQGHVDVVPAGDPGTWQGDAFTPRAARSDGRDVLVARGACDMKGGLVSVLAALAALRAAGVRRGGRVAVHSVVSEEDGGLGAFGTLARGHTGDACVIPEPTDRRVVTAAAGALTFRLEVPGRAVHGSSRAEGVSALEAFLPVHAALRELERRALRGPRPADGRVPRSPTRCRSGPSAPATGRAPCPTCSSRRAATACSWTRTQRRPVPRSRPPSSRLRGTTPGCATTRCG